MGNKIVAFAGSPRKDGFSWILLEELIKGAKSKGGEVKVYNLNDPGFRGCQGCYYCRTHNNCIQQDILRPFYDEVADVTGIVLTSPIYFADISGQAKCWLDRMFPMLDGQSFAPHHPGKRVVDIYAQGDGNAERFQPAFNTLHGFFRGFGWKVEDTIVCGGVGAAGFAVPGELKERAFKAGERLAE